MKRSVKRIFAGICFLLAVCFCLTMKSDKVYAQGAWYEDYEYRADLAWTEEGEINYLTLAEYQGNSTVLHIPATTVIEGVTYHTRLVDCFGFGKNKGKITNVTFEKGVLLPENCSFMFEGMKKLQAVNAEVFDMSKVTNTYAMFKNCKSLTKLDVSGWNVSNVTTFMQMFCGCEKLKVLDVSKWNTANVTDMDSMFWDCKSLAKLNVTNWNVSNVTSLGFMFYHCEKLDSLNLSRWDTSNVKYMYELFGCCYSIRKINLKGWDTSKVVDMGGMFCCNYNLESIDLSSFDMSKVKYNKNDDGMFLRCGRLKTIKTPKKLKKNFPLDTMLTYGKKNGKKIGSKVYTYLPKGNKSVTLVCRQSKGESTKIESVKSSKGKITLSWKAVDGGVQYEVQCSTNKNFTDAAGKLVKPLSEGYTYSVQEGVVEKTSATFKGLEKGKSYYVRVRVIEYGKLISDWSKAKKIKVK